MSIIRTEITLKNAGDIIKAKDGFIKEEEIRQMTLESTVDTGAWTIVINEEVRDKLGLTILDVRTGVLADGTRICNNMAGPIEVWCKGRRAVCDALVLPNTKNIYLGAIPMEIMDLTINPKRELIGIPEDEQIHLL